MTKRREFPRAVRVEVIKRCTRDGVVYCEACKCPAKRFQIDHVRADGLLGEPVLANASLICEPCFTAKNAADTTAIARAKRLEARSLGAVQPKSSIPSRPKPAKAERDRIPVPPRKDIYGRPL